MLILSFWRTWNASHLPYYSVFWHMCYKYFYRSVNHLNFFRNIGKYALCRCTDKLIDRNHCVHFKGWSVNEFDQTESLIIKYLTKTKRKMIKYQYVFKTHLNRGLFHTAGAILLPLNAPNDEHFLLLNRRSWQYCSGGQIALLCIRNRQPLYSNLRGYLSRGWDNHCLLYKCEFQFGLKTTQVNTRGKYVIANNLAHPGIIKKHRKINGYCNIVNVKYLAVLTDQFGICS